MATDDDEKRRLARRGLDLIDAADPDAIRARMRERASGAARGAVIRGLEVIADLTGGDASPGVRPSGSSVGGPADVGATLQSLDEHRGETFDARLRAATAAAAARREQNAELRAELADVRRSFPEASKQFAVLIFACVDLLDDLADHAEGRSELSAAEVERREQLLLRVSGLLAPRAQEAMASFVEHVVQVSRRAIPR
jgi:hypothetical protein